MIKRPAVANWLIIVSALFFIVILSILAVNLIATQVNTGQNDRIQSLENTVASLQSQINSLQNISNSGGNIATNTSVVNLNSVAIYKQDYQSIVTIRASKVTTVNSFFGPITSIANILGSGFVVRYNNASYIVTNFHVVDGTTNSTVTFGDGNDYKATVIGTDPYADLAVVKVEAPSSEFHPLIIAPSSTLQVGQPVVVIGNPFGLSGSMTVGIISQTGRTLQEQTTSTVSIPDVIQFSAPINPGNSGGPLLNAQGEVIGITTAIVGNAQGVGFAIPSDTVIRELPSLISTGKYDQHPYIGIAPIDMGYQIAQLAKSDVTYGVLIENVASGSPADKAGLKAGNTAVNVGNQQYLIGGDIIVSINGTRIVDQDALSSYLEEHTQVGQKITVGIIRDGKHLEVGLTLGKGPGLQGTV